MSWKFSQARIGLGRARTARSAIAGAGVVACALALGACSSSTSSSTAASGATPAATASGATAAATAGGGSAACGTVPQVAPNDPQHVVASLPASDASGYNLYQEPVLPSAWAHWKPTHPGPYKVAILWQPVVNTFVPAVLNSLTSALKASGKVQIVASVAPQNPTDIPGDLQLFNQLVAMKPDLIIAFPLAAGPFVAPINAAGKVGIPVVTPWSPVPSAYSIAVNANFTEEAASVAADVAQQIGGKGTVLEVHGIPGIQVDSDTFAGFNAALARCPGIQVAGTVTGDFSTAATKAAVLQFLSTHPGKIDAVLQTGTMTPGVIQAFQQLGRPIPAIGDGGSTQGSIAYAYQNASSYKEWGSSTPDAALGQVFAQVTLRTLAGDGPKINNMVTTLKPITNANLAQVYQSGWTLTSPDDASIPGDDFMSAQQLSTYFGTAQ